MPNVKAFGPPQKFSPKDFSSKEVFGMSKFTLDNVKECWWYFYWFWMAGTSRFYGLFNVCLSGVKQDLPFVKDSQSFWGRLGHILYSSNLFWSNYSDLTRPHPKWWFSKGIPLISGKSRLVKKYNLPRSLDSPLALDHYHIYRTHRLFKGKQGGSCAQKVVFSVRCSSLMIHQLRAVGSVYRTIGDSWKLAEIWNYLYKVGPFQI